MSSGRDLWASLLLVALLGLVLFLRTKYPNASKRAETSVVIGTTILFFLICRFYLM